MIESNGGGLSHFEIGVSDVEKAKSFFGKLHGWQFDEMPDGAAIDTPTSRGGLHGKDPDNCIVAYFAVADIGKAVRMVRELGGEAGDPGDEEPGWGRFSQCRDNQGVRFGLHQPPKQ